MPIASDTAETFDSMTQRTIQHASARWDAKTSPICTFVTYYCEEARVLCLDDLRHVDAVGNTHEGDAHEVELRAERAIALETMNLRLMAYRVQVSSKSIANG